MRAAARTIETQSKDGPNGQENEEEIEIILLTPFSVVQERYGFTGFGRRRIMDASFDPLANSAFEVDFAFHGQFVDEETGYYDYGYRYYSPQIGRWLSRDPIEEEGGVNLYGLQGNDAVNKVDGLGLQAAWSMYAKCERCGGRRLQPNEKCCDGTPYKPASKGCCNDKEVYNRVTECCTSSGKMFKEPRVDVEFDTDMAACISAYKDSSWWDELTHNAATGVLGAVGGLLGASFGATSGRSFEFGTAGAIGGIQAGQIIATMGVEQDARNWCNRPICPE